jgi:hypothetical protein
VHVFLAKERNISFDHVRDREYKTKGKSISFIMVKLEIESEESREAFFARLKIFSLALEHGASDGLISFFKFFTRKKAFRYTKINFYESTFIRLIRFKKEGQIPPSFVGAA